MTKILSVGGSIIVPDKPDTYGLLVIRTLAITGGASALYGCITAARVLLMWLFFIARIMLRSALQQFHISTITPEPIIIRKEDKR